MFLDPIWETHRSYKANMLPLGNASKDILTDFSCQIMMAGTQNTCGFLKGERCISALGSLATEITADTQGTEQVSLKIAGLLWSRVLGI